MPEHSNARVPLVHEVALPPASGNALIVFGWPKAWRPLTHDELQQQLYPRCFDVFEHQRIPERTKRIMGELAVLAEDAYEMGTTLKSNNFKECEHRGSRAFTRSIFYLLSSYDNTGRIVHPGSDKTHVPPLLQVEGTKTNLDTNLHSGLIFCPSQAFQTMIEQGISTLAIEDARIRLLERGIL